MDNIEILKKGYQYFAEGNVEAVLGLFHPDIEWNECKGFPFVTGDGTYNGPQAVAEGVFAKIPEYYDGFSVDIKELFGSGDRVVMEGFYVGTWKPTGKSFRANATHIWTVKNGLAVRFFQAVDTATIIS